MINRTPTINNFPLKLLIHEFEKICKNTNIKDITEEYLEYREKQYLKQMLKISSMINLMNLKTSMEKYQNPNILNILKNYQKLDIEIPEFIEDNYDLMFDEIIPNDISEKQKKKIN